MEHWNNQQFKEELKWAYRHKNELVTEELDEYIDEFFGRTEVLGKREFQEWHEADWMVEGLTEEKEKRQNNERKTQKREKDQRDDQESELEDVYSDDSADKHATKREDNRTAKKTKPRKERASSEGKEKPRRSRERSKRPSARHGKDEKDLEQRKKVGKKAKKRKQSSDSENSESGGEEYWRNDKGKRKHFRTDFSFTKSLPKFRGEFHQWKAFKRMMVNLVIEPKDISKHMKESIVLGKVEGEAERIWMQAIAQHKDVRKSWHKLQEYYENEDRVETAIQQAIIDMKSVSNSYDQVGLRALKHQVSEFAVLMQGLGVEYKAQARAFCYKIADKLWNEECKKVKTRCTNLDAVVERLEILISDSVTLGLHHRRTTGESGSGERKYKANSNWQQHQVNAVQSNRSNSSYRKCQLCESNDHFAANCVSVERDKLFAIAKEKRLCYRCLCFGHVSRDCKVKIKCGICGGEHCTVQHGVSIFFSNNNNNTNTANNAAHANAHGNSQHNSKSGDELKVEEVQCADIVGSDGRFWTKTIPERQRLATLIDHGATISLVSQNVVPTSARKKGKPIMVKGFGEGMMARMEEIAEITLDSPKGPIVLVVYICPVLPDNSLLIGRDEMGKVLQEESKWIHTIWGTYNITTGNWTASNYQVTNQEQMIEECNMAMRWYEDPEEETVDQSVMKLEVTKMSNGRYSVKLPFISDDRPPENHDKALSKLQRLRKRLIKENLYNDYDEQIQEWVESQSAAKVNAFDGHFINHREVLRPGAESTKFRIVLTPLMLNEYLWKGETAGLDVLSHLLRFRNYSYVFTADIQKAFLQIIIQEEHRKFLRFIWFKDGRPIRYQMNVLPFGVVSAPAILTTVLEMIVEELSPESKKILKGRVYMDDVITGGDNSEELIKAVKELKERLVEAGFAMHKERSNIQDHFIEKDCQSICKILGMIWNPQEDVLSVNMPELKKPNTKRELLSAAGKVFDPYGLFEPLKLELKKLFAMTLQADWDDPLPKDIQELAQYQINKIKSCPAIQLKRMIPVLGTFRAFCDASQDYLGYVIYFNDQFVFGRAKVIINKRSSVDGELQAMFEMFKALPKVFKCIDRQVELQAYSDSSINLQRLQKPMNELGVIEARRVMFILKEASKLQTAFYHIRGAKNPADYFTRDSKPEDAPFWMELNLDRIRSGSIKEFSAQNVLSAEKTEIHIHPLAQEFFKKLCLGKQLKWVRLLKNWMDRALKNLNKAGSKMSTLANLVHFYQQDEKAPPGCKQEDGVLVYPSRYDLYQPMWIPEKSKLANELLSCAHQDSKHRGSDMSMALLPDTVKIQNGNRRMRALIAGCLSCRKARAKGVNQPLGPYHMNQTEPSKPWEDICMDCFGPMNRKNGKKLWGLVVVCRSSKAVKLEAIQNMSGEVLYNVLHCLWDTIGFPRRVHTDNGTNFVYVKNRIEKENKLETLDTKWTFSTPGAPWMNGASERMVQITKDILDQFVKPMESYFGARRRFAAMERIVNSRPVLSIDEKCLSAFEVANNRKLIILPEEEGQINAHKMVKKSILREEEMVRAWKSAFLKKSTRYNPSGGVPVKIGDVFMVPDQMTRRKKWVTGIVRSLKLGWDGIVRSVYLEMSSGHTNWRPVQHLIPLSFSRPEVVNARVVCV